MYRPAHITKEQAEAGAAEWDAQVKDEGHKPATIAMVGAAFDVFLEVSKQQNTLIEILARRVAELESSHAKAVAQVQYKGVWDASTPYEPNQFVTFNGSLWACLLPNVSRRPGGTGSGDKCWQLSCKKGSDGRDGRDLR